MKVGYKNNPTKSVNKGYASNVKVVNTPTVKLEHDKPSPMPPTLRLTNSDLGAIKNWKVGSKYKLLLEVEQTSLSQGNEYDSIGEGDDSGNIRASFKVLNVKESQ